MVEKWFEYSDIGSNPCTDDLVPSSKAPTAATTSAAVLDVVQNGIMSISDT